MGLFHRKNNTGFNVSAGGSQTTPMYETAVLEQEGVHDNREHVDQLPSFQTNLVRKTSYSDATTRWLHTKANPYMHKHTYGMIDHIFYHTPFPFKYVSSDEEDLLKASELGGMKHVHRKWQQWDMFQKFKECVAQGNGVSVAWIVRIAPEYFLIFNSAQIDGDNYWRDPITHEITEVWFTWHGAEGGYLSGTKKNSEECIVKAKIGVNAVQYMPNPDVDTPFGRSDLLPIWMTGIYRELNAFYAVLFNKKGGINGRTLIAPDNMSATAKNVFKKEALKGIESELLEIYYPKGMVNAGMDPSKFVQWNENKGGNPAFNDTNTMLAANSPLPPSFIEGPASGALGGKAPEEDAKTINRFLMGQTSRIQKLVKDINSVFMGIQNVNYMIIPYFREEQSTKVDNKEENPLETPKTEEVATTNSRSAVISFNRQDVKTNSVNGMIIYQGNMLSSGIYEYQERNMFTGAVESVYEYLDPKEIEKFVKDPAAVKEFYVDLEHNQMLDVGLQTAIGKAIIKDTVNDLGVTKDKTELQFKSEWDPKHENIFLSPIYSVQLKNNGRLYKGKKVLDQTNISIINCSLCSYPRSGLTGLDTSAKRQV